MKKRHFLLISFLTLAGFVSYAQTYLILAKPMDAKTWGYADLKGEFVIAPGFSKCMGFSEDGYAPVYDGKAKEFYFIDKSGQKLETEIQGYKLYEIFGFGMKGFSDGLAGVKYQEKWGFINTEGKLVIPATFEKVNPFSSGFTAGLRDGKYWVVDRQGKEFPVDIPGVTDITRFSENMAVFKTEAGVGFLDGSGKEVIPPRFKSAGDFSGGIAWAKDVSDKCGYINAKGEWVIEPQFEGAKDYDPISGLARVKTADTWAYVTRKGELVYMEGTDLYEDFFDGLARGKKAGLFGYFNPKMEWAIEPGFDGARDFKNGFAAVKVGDSWGVIDKTGNWVIEPVFDDIKDVELIR